MKNVTRAEWRQKLDALMDAGAGLAMAEARHKKAMDTFLDLQPDLPGATKTESAGVVLNDCGEPFINIDKTSHGVIVILISCYRCDWERREFNRAAMVAFLTHSCTEHEKED